MIIVQSPLKRDYIISLLDGKTIDSVNFRFHKREEMSLYFEHDGSNEEAAAIAKKAIKNSEFGPALFFRVTYD
ncbi:MAG: hypothetical protein FH749_10445 [Firmicutes bacterium]|nr:hypothetical protein [Bacillota bacterium]